MNIINGFCDRGLFIDRHIFVTHTYNLLKPNRETLMRNRRYVEKKFNKLLQTKWMRNHDKLSSEMSSIITIQALIPKYETSKYLLVSLLTYELQIY